MADETNEKTPGESTPRQQEPPETLAVGINMAAGGAAGIGGAASTGPTVSCTARPQSSVYQGSVVTCEADVTGAAPGSYTLCWSVTEGFNGDGRDTFNHPALTVDNQDQRVAYLNTARLRPGSFKVKVRLFAGRIYTSLGEAQATRPDCDRLSREAVPNDTCELDLFVMAPALSAGDEVRVAPGERALRMSLQRSQAIETETLPLWSAIREAARAVSFENYNDFINRVMCGESSFGRAVQPRLQGLLSSRALPFPGVDAYRLLKVATELFLMLNCGIAGRSLGDYVFDPRDPDTAADLRRVGLDPADVTLTGLGLKPIAGSGTPPAETFPFLALLRNRLGAFQLEREERLGEVCKGILLRKLTNPCLIELIWSYWHEEGMLVQTLNAVSVRFQNKRVDALRDPLRRLNIDYLRGLNNLLWGYIQDEQHRLTVARRAYEYDHHYGLSIEGRAVPKLKPADSRSKFLEAFHNLLHLATVFFKEDDDLTVNSDAFPLLNALREVHLLLAEGMDNQFGDLPSTARMEMLMQQWLLARDEMREFLGGRITTPYSEPWMDRVDTMKALQGWTDVSVTYFNDLAVVGEQLLLSIRFGGWSDNALTPADAANWARSWRPEIQRYIHSYRAVTGVDLAANASAAQRGNGRYLPPSVHLRNRLAAQRRER